jgi:uncharacterized Zn finger protein
VVHDLRAVLDRPAIAELAQPQTIKRGEAYVRQGRVGPIAERDGEIAAEVRGELAYSVRLFLDGTRLGHECSCPIGGLREFCKHCVALAIAWLEPELAATEPGRSPASRRQPGGADPVPDFLASLDRTQLVALVMDEASANEALAANLRLRAAGTPKSADLAPFKDSIDRAIGVRGFVEYRAMPGFARKIEEAVTGIERLLSSGNPEAVIALSEHAIKRVEKALHHVDDSDGVVGDQLRRLQGIHHQACRAARPDPLKLAARLLRWELSTDWDVFFGAAETYADVLGEKGLAEYRRLADVELSKRPVSISRHDASNGFDHDAFAIEHAMRAVARALGDVDLEVATISRDLTSTYSYLQIAQALGAAGRADEALGWAERGMREFSAEPDHRLQEFVAAQYMERSRPREAMDLVWLVFAGLPELSRYRTLKSFAERAGAWPEWRERALGLVRGRAEANLARQGGTQGYQRDRWTHPPGSELVDILLWEGELDAALDTARRLDCRSNLWLELAKRIETAQPDDAVAILQREADIALRISGRSAYAEAVALLARLKALMTRIERSGEFAAFASSVRSSNSRRPAFLELFDKAHLLEERPVQPDDHMARDAPDEETAAMDPGAWTRPPLRIVHPGN